MQNLPNSIHVITGKPKCENHSDRPATSRIQGETDSYGAEYHDLCAECAKAHFAYVRSEEARTGICDWCKATVTTLGYTRDPDEGMNGPVYRICSNCSDRQKQRLREELDAYDDYDD